MKRTTKRTQGLLPIHLGGAAVCVVLLALGWLLGLGPLLSDTQAASSTIEEARQAQQATQAGKAELDALTQRLEATQAELDQRPVSLQSADTINPLLAELAGWADEHQLELTRTNAGQPIALAYYDYVPIMLAGEGAYGELLGFFHKLHAGRGDLGVVSFNVARRAATAGVAYEIELAWYVKSRNPGVPEATASVPAN